MLEPMASTLEVYHNALRDLRVPFSQVYTLPSVNFFLFGMGMRRKLFYQGGALRDAHTGEVLAAWSAAQEKIVPSAYQVIIYTTSGQLVQIIEDEKGVWIIEGEKHSCLTAAPLRLPAFANHRFGPLLRVLHHEVLINIDQGLPLPNFFVYRKPWYRDTAMMAMVLRETGNLDLLRPWVLGLTEPYDRNNAGETEPDNLGQALFLLSLFTDAHHPLVSTILDEARRFTVERAIVGRSDFSEHPVYQTKWMKFGLECLRLPDPYRIPAIKDTYSSLFWWQYTDQHVNGQRFDTAAYPYPYLGWAEAHFFRDSRAHLNAPLADQLYPLSWEAEASQANYEGIRCLAPVYADAKLSAPHTWHAAEMFLYLLTF